MLREAELDIVTRTGGSGAGAKRAPQPSRWRGDGAKLAAYGSPTVKYVTAAASAPFDELATPPAIK